MDPTVSALSSIISSSTLSSVISSSTVRMKKIGNLLARNFGAGWLVNEPQSMILCIVIDRRGLVTVAGL